MNKKILKTALFSSLTFLYLNGVSPVLASTSESLSSTWVANAPESLKIKKGQTSYTLALGDTLWAISQRTNITVETLASINNIDLSKGEQYFLPVGRVIQFDGNKVVVTEPNGNVVSETIIKDEQKVNPQQNVGEPVKPLKPNETGINDNSTENGDNDSTESGSTEGETTPENSGGNEGSEAGETTDTETGGETPTEPSNPEGGNTGGGETTDPGETGGGEGENPGSEIPEGPYSGTIIPGVNNGAVGTWTDKNEMMDYIENNWDAVSGGLNDYSMTTNGYGWIAMFY